MAPEASRTPTPSTTPTASAVTTGAVTPAPPNLGASAARRVVLDPVTRIEGHLRVEIEVENGAVSDAWVSGGLFRGMEAALKGRAAADAFYIAQRICGVCPVPHGHAATMAAESAMGIRIPNGARIVRNIIEGAEFLHSHILWFYTLAALDYVDVASALTAEPVKTAEAASKAGTRMADFSGIQARLQRSLAGGKMSVFGQGWWGHPEYRLSPELNLVGVAHYLEALEIQADAAAIIAIMGGKFPHFMTSLPGGTAWVPTEEKLDGILWRLQRIKSFVDEALIPDTFAIGASHLDATKYGRGVGNYLAWGVFEDASMDPVKRFLPRGTVLEGKLEVIPPDETKIMEYVDHAWYTSDSGNRAPKDGVTTAAYSSYDTDTKYSWVKAPRLDGRPMEAGPLARLLVAYASGAAAVTTAVNDAVSRLGAPGDPSVLMSLLGRVAARSLETALVAEQMVGWVDELIAAFKSGDAKYFTESAATEGDGAGLWEAPRGALGHWMRLRDGLIDHYQVVTPSTWNVSPRDADGTRGPLEEALVGTPVTDPERPLEALRVVHSFDP